MDLGIANLIAGGIGAVGNLFSGIASSKKALQAVQETNQANRDLAEYQFDRNLEMWNYQNEYNTPQNQMQRLIDAGLNPNLMYGQGDTGNASSAPQYDAPRMEAYTNFGDFGVGRASQELMQGLMGYANIKKTEAEAENIRQNTQNLEVQKQLAELQIIQQGYANSKSKEEAKVWGDLYRSKMANLDSSTINNLAHGQLADSQRFFTDAQKERFSLLTPYYEKKLSAEIDNILIDNNLIKPAQLQKLKSDVAYQSLLSKIADKKAQLIGYELEYAEESNKYVSERAINENWLQRFQVQIKQDEKELIHLLREKGIDAAAYIFKALK